MAEDGGLIGLVPMGKFLLQTGWSGNIVTIVTTVVFV